MGRWRWPPAASPVRRAGLHSRVAAGGQRSPARQHAHTRGPGNGATVSSSSRRRWTCPPAWPPGPLGVGGEEEGLDRLAAEPVKSVHCHADLACNGKMFKLHVLELPQKFSRPKVGTEYYPSLLISRCRLRFVSIKRKP